MPPKLRDALLLAQAGEYSYEEIGAMLHALLEPLDVAPIAVAPLAVETLTPDSIQIERLDAIAPITVAPLDITDAQRRNP